MSRIRRQKTYEETHMYMDGIELKMCWDCEQWFPMTSEYFYKSARNKHDGFHNTCKTCSIKRSARIQADNHDKSCLYKRHWYIRNRKHEADKAKKRYQDPEKRKRNLERAKEFRRNNPERVREYSRNHPNHEITTNEWEACKGYFDHECAYCGIFEGFAKDRYGHGLHKEHVIPGGRNDIKNCVPACMQCNSEKNIHSLNNWYNESNPKYARRRYMKIVQWLKYGCRQIKQ